MAPSRMKQGLGTAPRGTRTGRAQSPHCCRPPNTGATVSTHLDENSCDSSPSTIAISHTSSHHGGSIRATRAVASTGSDSRVLFRHRARRRALLVPDEDMAADGSRDGGKVTEERWRGGATACIG